MAKTIPVVEMFGPTIQGEGNMAGRATNFIRVGGCGYNCRWCDSMFAVEPEQFRNTADYLTPEEIAEKAIATLPRAPWMSISGGDPVMRDLTATVTILQQHGYKVNVETQGQLYRPWLKIIDNVTVSPKPPSSGMADKINYKILDKYAALNTTIFKVVIFNGEDYGWAKDLHKRYSDVDMYLSTGTLQGYSDHQTKLMLLDKLRDLFEKVASDPEMHDCIVLPQLHVLAWGTRQGV